MPGPEAPLLRLERISKSFAGVPALRAVDFEVLPGEVHALVGENGAGKSTLMNIAGGVLPPGSGRILWEGHRVRLRSPRDARRLGIAFVHQDLALVPQLSVGENIFLGQLPAGHFGMGVRWREVHQRAEALLGSLGHAIDPRTPVEELSIAARQLVEIARALASNARLIVMDEPTAPLSERETGRLLEVIARLRAAGVAVVYITHLLKEIQKGPDRVTVLRDGVRVASGPVSEMPRELLIRHMVGRDVEEQFPARPPHPASAETALRIVNFTRAGEFQGVNLELRRGEIVGLAGLVGAGRTEVLEAIFGAGRLDAGTVYIEGTRVSIRSPRDAIRRGIALAPDDRKGKGLIPGASVRWNMAIAARRDFLIRRADEALDAARLVGELRVRIPNVEKPVTQLSGGNQQKVVLAKWLLTGARIFLFDEPARGVDVGAKAEIYALIRGLAERGAAVLFASSDLDEVLRLADRIIVMHRGRVAGELAGEAASAESVMRLATGAQ